MLQKSIVFLGSKPVGYRCFKHLLDNREKLDYKVPAVLTSKHSLDDKESVTALAEQHGIPVLDSLEDLFDIPRIDYLFSVQYHEILKHEHIDVAYEMAINLHMAPLPEYRGCNQFSFAIIDEAKEFGTTIHRMEMGVDNGAILFEKRFPIPGNCYVNMLYEMTVASSERLFIDSLPKILSGDFDLTPQSELVKSRGMSFHLRKEIEDIKQIDLQWEKEKIDRYFRATYFPPFEPPFAVVDGKRIPLTENPVEG